MATIFGDVQYSQVMGHLPTPVIELGSCGGLPRQLFLFLRIDGSSPFQALEDGRTNMESPRKWQLEDHFPSGGL